MDLPEKFICQRCRDQEAPSLQAAQCIACGKTYKLCELCWMRFKACSEGPCLEKSRKIMNEVFTPAQEKMKAPSKRKKPKEEQEGQMTIS